MRVLVVQYILLGVRKSLCAHINLAIGRAGTIHLRAESNVGRCPFSIERLTRNASTVDLRRLAAVADLCGGLGHIAIGFPGQVQLYADRFYCG
jgi:hypothetical protein